MNLRRENPFQSKPSPTVGPPTVLRMLGVGLVLLFARAEGAEPAAPGGGIDLPTHRAELASGLVVNGVSPGERGQSVIHGHRQMASS